MREDGSGSETWHMTINGKEYDLRTIAESEYASLQISLKDALMLCCQFGLKKNVNGTMVKIKVL